MTPIDSPTIFDLPLEVKADEAGSFEGYASIFGVVDRDGDRVAPGAFADSLKGRKPALLWQHNPKDPIGRFDVVREDAKGLYVKGRLAMEGRGAEAYALLKMGALDGLSIGFVTKEAARDAASGVRTITKAELAEISLVTFPANTLARIEAVKGNTEQQNTSLITPPDSPRAFETFLREQGGFSRSRAKALVAKGWGGEAKRDTNIEDIIKQLDPARFEEKRFQRIRPFRIIPRGWSEWVDVYTQFGVSGPNAAQNVTRLTVAYSVTGDLFDSRFKVQIDGGDRFINAAGAGKSIVTITGNVATTVRLRARSFVEPMVLTVTVS